MELFDVSTGKVFKAVEKITYFIYSVSNKFIFLPDTTELTELSKGFSSLGRVEGTVLAIDGTHIPFKLLNIGTENTLTENNFIL